MASFSTVRGRFGCAVSLLCCDSRKRFRNALTEFGRVQCDQRLFRNALLHPTAEPLVTCEIRRSTCTTMPPANRPLRTCSMPGNTHSLQLGTQPGAEAIALLRPPATTPVMQAGHYVVRWDGHAFTHFARIEYHPL